jgi:nucleotide-binding universal stress UspA family protein
MMNTIVVGYDGTEGAELALERAVGIAEVFASNLVVAVVEQIIAAAVAPVGMGEVSVTVAEPLEGGWARESQIERARSLLDARGVSYEIVSPIGNIAAEIVDVADEHGADLIVVGTNEPGLLERLFLGSISGSVARTANCDVLVVHQKRPETS